VKIVFSCDFKGEAYMRIVSKKALSTIIVTLFMLSIVTGILPASAEPIPIQVNAGESIQAAIDLANSGDLIIVNTGTYYQSFIVNKPLTIESNGAIINLEGTIFQTAIFVVSSGVTLSGFTIRNSITGIQASGSSNVILENNVIWSMTGINAVNVPGIAIVNNVVYAHTSNPQTRAVFGIILGGQFSGGLIEGNEITADYLGSVASCGINVVGPSNIEISKNTIVSANNAIFLADVPDVKVSENVLTAKSSAENPLGHAITLKPMFSGGFSGGLIEKNQVTSDFKGIFVQGEPSTGAVSDVEITENVVYQAANGIEANNAPNVVIRDNLVYSQMPNPLTGRRFGIILGFSYNGGFVENNEVYSEDTGIQVGGPSEIEIRQNTVYAKKQGITVGSGLNEVISDNTVFAGEISNTVGIVGIGINGANPTVTGNHINSTGTGINVFTGNEALIQSNIVDSAVTGIYVQSLSNSKIAENTLYHNIAPLGAGIFMKMSSYCNVFKNTVYNNRNGIYLDNSDNNQITFNTAYENNGIDLNTGCGIYLFTGCDSNEISNNLVYDSTNSGIAVRSSSNGNTVDHNSVSDSDSNGIFIGGSTLNTVSCNTISKNNVAGIRLFGGAINNLIVDNIIIENTNGVFVDPNCNNNRVYSNSFVTNPTQAKCDSTTTNVWDNGYPEGGNYWSNYIGIDEYGGVYQNLPGSDGIADTPYMINSNNQDHYPLMTQKTVVARILALRRTIEAWNLPKGTENSLTVKLDNALHQINKENEDVSINMLNAFINEVKAQQNKALTNEQANYLIAQAQKIITQINT
jgi:parallel beta-helix repeat protein